MSKDNSINSKVANATKWSFLTEIIVKIISPITNMILARVLTPEAFGVVATVTMIVSFTDIFTDAGFQKYLVQHQFQNDDEKDLATCVAFWTNICISVLLWFLIFVNADRLAYAVGNEGMGRVIYIGALILPLTSFSSIQTALFRKDLNYKSISLVRIVVKIIPMIVTVPLALIGMSYWALIVGNIVGELCQAVLLTVMSKWKPKFKYSIHRLYQMFQFCGWTLLETISSWLVTNVGIFVIGRLFDTYYLGIYKTATTMVGQITSLISGATISVLFSALSQIQDDEIEYKRMYSVFLKGIGMVVVPLGVGIFLYKDVVRSILLGGQWAEADLLLGLWGFVLAESVIFNDMSGAVILSKGHPKLLFVSNMSQAVLMVPALYISSRFGFKILVIVSCLIRIQLPLTQSFMAQKVSSVRLLDVIYSIRHYIYATIIMSLVAILMKSMFLFSYSRYVGIFVCIIVYFASLLLFPGSRTVVKEYIQLAKRKVVK